MTGLLKTFRFIKISHTNNFVFCLFFQAEDGIRDLTVTGVDVCSSDLLGWHEFRDPNEEWELTLYRYNANVVRQLNQNIENAKQAKAFEQWNSSWVRFVERNVGRSEGRRVGKEWRSRRAQYQ